MSWGARATSNPPKRGEEHRTPQLHQSGYRKDASILEECQGAHCHRIHTPTEIEPRQSAGLRGKNPEENRQAQSHDSHPTPVIESRQKKGCKEDHPWDSLSHLPRESGRAQPSDQSYDDR